jgi:hypothetical protein
MIIHCVPVRAFYTGMRCCFNFNSLSSMNTAIEAVSAFEKARVAQIGHGYLYQIPKHFTVAPDKWYLDLLLRSPATRG